MTNEDNDIQHSVYIVGWGAKDHEIRAFAKSTCNVVVSSDYNMLCQCLDSGIQTALYYKGRAYLIRLSSVEELGIHAPTLGFIAP